MRQETRPHFSEIVDCKSFEVCRAEDSDHLEALGGELGSFEEEFFDGYVFSCLDSTLRMNDVSEVLRREGWGRTCMPVEMEVQILGSLTTSKERNRRVPSLSMTD